MKFSRGEIVVAEKGRKYIHAVIRWPNGISTEEKFIIKGDKAFMVDNRYCDGYSRYDYITEF